MDQAVYIPTLKISLIVPPKFNKNQSFDLFIDLLLFTF